MKQRSPSARKTGRPLSFDRDAVLRKAMLTFWHYGYETTSIADLTATMGVTAPSIYAAFGDKKRLFLEAMRLYAGSPPDLARTLDNAATARDAVFEMLKASAEGFTGEATPPGCLLASAAASGSKDAADVQEAVAAVRRDITAILIARIERDIAAGILPDSADAAALATLVIALIQGMSVLARDGVGRDSLDAMITVAIRAWPGSPEHVTLVRQD